ncbi:hypothetical protein VC83_08717 [Pseudogymnoascus destructans]|uniref:Uncharacterized protein n=2 Tax=Pseudogymnoascus destructans TaxID=655981 RepID=L8G9K6_PSED2|nr:uncharacterized protein VC83_08717 [Pseudogymnoascus destructans]ELR09544.1 hypothetical protein GMDG_04039 [Pseudogymnoascus destructans 20631-21]OAF55090.1 hypothetical protein VC83_08717 [Pseudogymnoascus destructans]
MLPGFTPKHLFSNTVRYQLLKKLQNNFVEAEKAGKPKTLDTANRGVIASGPFARLFQKDSEATKDAEMSSEESDGDDNASRAPKRINGPTTKEAHQAAKQARDSAVPTVKPKQPKKASPPRSASLHPRRRPSRSLRTHRVKMMMLVLVP